MHRPFRLLIGDRSKLIRATHHWTRNFGLASEDGDRAQGIAELVSTIHAGRGYRDNHERHRHGRLGVERGDSSLRRGRYGSWRATRDNHVALSHSGAWQSTKGSISGLTMMAEDPISIALPREVKQTCGIGP